MKFALFMSTPAGRILRIVAGAALIVVGVVMQPTLGIVTAVVIAVVGVIVLLAGTSNVCLIAPILRQPFTGRAIRERAAKK
jgi:hypothetical protein